MKAPLTSVILAAALPMFSLAEMTAWFNPQIETYTTWPTNNAAAFGGEWVNVENATLEAEWLSVNDGDFSFLANESKNLDDGKVVVCWQGEGDACLNVPAVPDGAKSGLCVVSNSNATATYHILSIVPESEINEWVDTGIPYVAQEPVSLVIDSTNEPNKVTTTYLFASRGVATATTIVTNEEKTVSQICFNGNLKIRLLHATSEQSDIEWTYSITNGIAVLGTGSYYGQAVTNAVSGVVEIPETIGGCPVGEISAWAFRGCTGITSVAIPPSVSKIGTGAFEGCTNLKTISLPDDLRSVSSLLFSRCESLEELVIPEGVTSVGNNVIQGCSSLKRLILPTTLVSAVDNAFANAPALEEVVGLENVTDGCYFSYSIFSGDSSLKRVDLSRIDVSGGVGMFSSCTSLEEVILPTRGWAIGEWAFAGCTSLTNVAPAYRIAGIGSGAFSGCDALESFTIYGPASVPPVEATNGSFRVCTYISTNAFLACSNLSQVVFKGYPIDDEDYHEGFVADDAFDGCTAAIGVYSPRYSDIWTDAIDDNGKWHGLSMQVGEAEPMTLIIEDDVVVGYRGDCADQIVIPEGVKGIAQYAFAGCLALKSVSIPDSVTNIGEYAFANCSNLVSVVFNGDEPYARWASFAGMRSDCVFYVSGDDREWSIDIPGRWYEHPILYWSPVSIQNEEYLIFAEDFEKGATLMSLMTVGTFPTPPGIKDNMGVGESRAFSFGRSSAGSNAWTSYMNTLIARFDREYVITRIEFDEMERYDNWGSQGTLQANGMTIENTGFAKLPSNNHVADTEFRHRSFDVSVVATNLSFHCEDITSSSELFIDNIRIYGRPLSYYVVSTIGSDDNDGKSCDSAFRTIQQAVDVASDGDTIYVLPGLYEPVICTNKAVFVEAIGGAGATVIDAGYTNHCARFDQYVGYEWEAWERTSKLTGFTLINGFACDYSEDWLNAVGGGVVGGILENCIITQCHAENGGGAYGSELNDCLLEENWGNWFGGAAMCHLNRCVIRSNHTDNEGGGVGRESIANNCLIVSNTSSSYSGAGASQSTLNNCTVVNNISDCTHGGAGVYCCNAVNCIVWGNYNNRGLNLSNWFRYEDSYDYGQMSYTCTYPLFEGEGNTSDDPQLAKISADEYRIGRNSPCLDSGSPIWNSSETDLAGAPRVQGTSVDMGCYEGAANGVIVHTAVSEGYGSISESFVASQGESVVVRATSTDDARPLEGFYINGAKAESSQVRKEGADYLLEVTLGDSDVSIEARFVTYNFHVATSGDDSNDGLSWDTAKRTIQAAVSIARPQDSVIVTNGVYAPFRKNDGYDITISSVNGALETIIDGGGTNRCAYLYDADMHMVKLVGFTLQNGYATYGGGVYGGRVSKCIIRNNVATRTGGGSCYTWLDNCLVMDNVAASSGGGVAGTGYNASSGIAGWPSVMRNCTVVGNQAATGGGVEYTYAINSIVVNNVATNSVSTNGTWNCQYVNVCIDPSRASGTCVGLAPLFVNAANGDYRLSSISPCIDAGDNAYVESATDLGGNARVVGDRVDIGAYEFEGLSRFNVAFYLGEHGSRIGGGELEQSVIEGAAAVAPEVSGERGWLFDGWDADFSAVCSNMTVVALWSPLTEYRGSVTSSTVDFATVIWDGGVSFPDVENTYSNLVLNIETNAVLTVRERLAVDSLILTGNGNILIQMVGDGAFYPGAINTSSYGGTLNFKLCDGARLDYYLGRSQGTYTAPTGGDFLPFLTYGLEVDDGGRLGFTYTTNGHCNIESYDFSKITGTGTVSLDTIYNGNSNWILLPDSRFAETLSFNIESDVVVPPSYGAENPFYVRNFSGNGRFRCDWNDSLGNYIMREFYTMQTRNTTFTGRFMSNTNGNGAREVNMHVLSDGDVPDYENKRLILSGEGGLIDTNGGLGFYDAKGALTVLTNGALEINYMWGGAADIYGAVGGCGGFSSNVVFETGAEFILSTNGHLTATGSLAFGDSLTVRTDEEPMGLLVLAVEDSVAVPDISNTDLILYVKGERSDLFRFLVMEDGLYVAPKEGVRSVRFDVGEHGHRAGGGNLLQFITDENSIEAPVMRGDDGWVFVGWDVDLETMEDGDVATAQYKTLKADLHIDALDVPESATTGDRITIAWTVGNTGNPNWSGRTVEQIRLVNASDPLNVIVIANLAETLYIERDGGQLLRSYEWAIPAKGPVGEWYVEVETAIGASNEHGGVNLSRSEATLTIAQCPLPDLSVKSIALDLDPAEYMPLDTVTVRYVVQNTGTGAAKAPWRDRLYLCKNGTRINFATLDETEDIAVGAEVERTIQCVIPELVALSGDVSFVVKADCDDSIVELADDDAAENAAWEATPNATLGKRLYLTFAAPSVNENNSGGVRFYAKRSGETDKALVLSLTAAGATSDVNFPTEITIGIGSSTATGYVKPIDNTLVDGTRTVAFTLVPPEGAELDAVTSSLAVVDNEVPKLTMSFDKTNIKEGDGTILVTLTRELVTDEPLTVYLNGVSTSHCAYPASVVIPAGAASVTFEIDPVNNDAAEITAALTLRASANGYTAAAQSFTVEDDDVPSVTLTIYPEELSEGAGPNAAYAILSRVNEDNIGSAITVNLTPSLANQVIMQSSITIPAYTMAVRFPIGTVDNGEDEGDRDITITGSIYIPSCGCSGQPSSGDVIEATIRIIDNDTPALALTADPSTMKEGLEHAGDLILSHNSALTEDLVVTLSYDTEGEIEIPASVVIPAGETSVTIPVKTIDDGETDGGKLVSVYADDESGAFKTASTWIQVSDQNLPDLKVSAISLPTTINAGKQFEIEFETANIGFINAPNEIEYALHLVGGTRGSSATSSNKIGSGKITGGIVVNDSIVTSYTITSPSDTGDYRVIVVIDPDGEISELDDGNNSLTSDAIAVSAAYTATVSVAEKVYLPGDEIVFTGSAVMPDGTTPAANLPVDLYVYVNGMRRTYNLMTDASGAFGMTFAPSSGEAGRYTIGACYPGVSSSVAQDYFDILGMKRSSTSNIIWDYALGDVATRTVYIQNRSGTPLTGLTVEFSNVPEACSLEYTLPDTIPANGTVALTMTATAVGVTEQVDYSKFTAHLEVAEGLTLDFPLYFHSQTQKAYLRANPSSINTTMAIGHTRYIDVTITNDGKGDSGKITLSVPDVSWLRIVSGTAIDNLASGESATVTLEVAPTKDDNLTLNNPLSGGILAVNCANGTGCNSSLQFTPVSEATGAVKIDAVDNNTYYLESRPHLANAYVRLSNPYTGVTIASGTTDDSGVWIAEGIPEGEYQLTVTADKHDSYANSVSIDPGCQATITAFLQYQVVVPTWTVVRNEIEDSYEVKLIMEYETQVPAPVVKVTMPDSFAYMEEGESVTFTMHVVNEGLISAESVHLYAPDIPNHSFTFADNDFKLAAGASRDIPVKFEHLVQSRAKVLLGKSGGLKVGTWLMGHLINYICGDYGSYNGFTSFKYGTEEDDDDVIDDDDDDDDPYYPPKVVIYPDPKRKNPGDPSDPEPGRFRGNRSNVSISGCDIAKCFMSVAGCILDLAIKATVGKVPDCLMGLTDCGAGIYSVVIDDDRTTYDIVSKSIDCGLSVAGCIPALGDIPAMIACGKNIGENCIVPAYQWVKDKFTKKDKAKLGATSSDIAEAELGSELLDRFPNLAYAISIAGEELPAIRNWHVEFFGDEAWMQCDPEQKVAFLSAFKANLPKEGEFLSASTLQPYRPDGISEELVVKFVSRWNEFLKNGIQDDSGEEAGESSAIRPMYLIACSEKVSECEELVASQGYSSIFEYLQVEAEKFNEEIENERKSVCASVTLELSQTVAMTREVFDGTLTLKNGNTAVPVKDLKMDVSVLDENGNECKDLFVIFANGTSGDMSNGSVLEGGLSVSAGGTGSAMIRFVPSREAAPTEDKLYRFGGTITYTDPFSGEIATVKLKAVSLTVSPSPYLHLDYFVQRDVFADDPFTLDIVEASMPAEMAVLVRNIGAGQARNVTIASAKPEVVQNEKGLAVEFDWKDYSTVTSALNGATAHLGLNTVSLGTIEPEESMVAQWWLTSSIEGHFIGMSATVTPVNSWNTPDTMLVDPDVGVHKLVRSVVADADTLPDFLVCDGSDLYGTPNEIYTAKGEVVSVYVANLSTSTELSGAEIALPISVSPNRSGWNYGYLAKAGLFRYTITRIVRGDGEEISLRNAWITDRTFRDGNTPLLEERLHIVDEFESGDAQTYTVYLTAKPSDVPEVVEYSVLDGAIEYVARNSIEVQFSKAIDATTFTLDALVLRKKGTPVADISALTIAASDETGTKFTISGLAALCGDLGRYELVVQCAGIADLSGQLGTSSKSVAWVLSTPDSPYILDAEGRPTKRVRRMNGVTTVTSIPVTEESVRNLVVTLNGTDVSQFVTIRPADETGTRFAIEGLDELQLNDGDYTLVIDGGNLVGLDGGSGIESYTVTWTRDTVAPVLNSVRRETGLNGTTFVLELSEDADPETISLENVMLTRKAARTLNAAKRGLLGAAPAGETEITLPATARLTALGNGGYTVTGIDSAILEDGTYTLYFDAAGVADEAGNEVSGTKSVTWTVDTTAPDAVSDIAVSSEYGSVDTVVYTSSRELTVSGTVPEAELTVEIFSKYVGETLLAEPVVDGNLRFSADLTLPGDCNLTIIIRLTDEYGNSSDTEFAVYVDAISLGTEITGMPEPDEAADTLTITFLNGTPDEATALAATKSLTLDGVAVAIPNVTIAKTDDARVYTVSGLGDYTAAYGTYVFTYDVREVKKASSGLAGDAIASTTWVNYPIDTTPPTIAEIRFDGALPAAAYVTDQMFTEVSVRFSEAVNVPSLVAQGIAGQAFMIQFLSDDNAVVGTLNAEDVAWNATTFSANWTIDGSAVPCGKARLVVDPSLIKDASGNGLATTDAYDVISGAKAYTPSLLKSGVAHSYACPALYDWNNDKLLDLVVGEKTEDGKGKVRIYLNRGTASAPVFDDYTYLQKSGEDVEFTAQGCVGMSVSFGHLRKATMILASSQGEIYGWRNRSRNPKTKDSVDWDLWFDHSMDSRFSSLIRTQTFCCDIDGDGYDEVIVSGQNSPMFWIKRTMVGEEYVTECTPLMDATGANLQFPEGQNHTSAILTDVSGDSIPDLVTGDTAGNVWVYYGTGNARFASKPLMIYVNTETSNKRSRLTVGDIDGDGVEDVLVGRQDGSVLLLKGEAVLAPAVNFKCVEIKSVEEALNDYIYWENGADGWTCEQFGEEAQATVTHDSDAQTTVLTAKFTGMGTVSFTWAVTGSNESSEFRCTGGDSELVKTGPFSQVAQSVTLSTPGEHLVSWVFKGRNTAIVRDVAFTPTDESLQVTQTTVVPIPFADINRFANDVWKAQGGDYEAAAKATAANGKTVLENCIVGLDSSDPKASFKAKITYEDGKAKISWIPALNGEIDNEGIPTGIRTYTIYGTENLETPNWRLVTPENKPSMRFFKVTVEMP